MPKQQKLEIMAVTFLEDCFTSLLPECLPGPLMLVLTA